MASDQTSNAERGGIRLDDGHGDITMSSKIYVSRRGFRGPVADLAVELQEDVMTATQRPYRYHDGNEWVEDGYFNRHQLEFACKRYLVSFESVKAILGESSLGTRRFLAAISARAWTINGSLHYALDEVLTTLACSERDEVG